MEAPGNVPSNLWDIARKRLTHDEEAQLAKVVVENNTLSQQLLELVYAKQQQCMDRRLKFKRSNGDVIVLRDIFEKVVKWLQKFKEVGDVATQYDPAHAALPWAGVRMLLQIAINDTETLGAIAEGIETISHLIARCAIYEGLYLTPRSFPLRQPHTMLRDALVSLYAVILEWLSKAGVYYAKPVGRRCLAAIMSPAPTLTSISQKEQAVLQLATAIQDQTVSTMAGVLETMDANFISLLAILKDLEQPIVRIIGTLDLIANNMKAKEQARLAIWLSRIRHEYVHKQVHRLVPDTGQWLLRKKEYIEWRDSSCSSTLWLHGVPGCGKSKLSSLVVQQHRDRVSCNANAAPVAFCYCSRSGIDGSPPTPPIIMGSILKQLAFFGPERGVYHSVRDEFCRRVNDAQGLEPIPLSLDDCQELIILITADYPVTIIVDGLDEAQGEIRDLLDTLQRIMEESQNIVKLFVSSRAETPVDIHLQQSFKSIQVTSADIAQDISTFVKDKVNAAVRYKRLLGGQQVCQELESRVIEALISVSYGMFLWASLNLEQLCGPEFALKADVDEELETLRAPTSIMNILEEMYQRVLKYRPRAKAITNTVFGCLLISERRISQSELLDMISVSTYSETHDDFIGENTLNLEDVRNLCRGFVDFTDPCSFSFAHDTIREYIARREEFQPSDLHHVAMSRCLKYLTRQYRDLRLFSPGNPSRSAGTAIPDNIRLFARDADNDEQDTVPVSFWFYAVCYWPRHYSMIECVERRSKAEAEVLQFVFGDQGYRHNMWLEDVLKLIYQPSRASKPSAVTHLWWELNDCQSPSHSPIFVASVYGITGITRQLAKKSDEIDWNMRNKDGVSAVTLSASWGRDDTLEFLLMQGASVNTTEGHYGTPIQAASFHGNTRAVQVLMENGADPLAKGFFDTALHAAFSGGHEPTIQLLVDNDTCHKSTNLGTLIRAASYNGYHGALKSLLQRYFDDPGKSQDILPDSHLEKNDALQAALYTGEPAGRIKSLLEAMPDVNEQGGLFGNPLQAACLGGSVRWVRVLLQRGADPLSIGHCGSALRAASLGGHDKVVGLLLEKPVVLGPGDQDALEACALWDRRSTMRKLIKHFGLEKTSDYAESKRNFYGAMRMARLNHNNRIIKLLVKSGARWDGLTRCASRLQTAKEKVAPKKAATLTNDAVAVKRKLSVGLLDAFINDTTYIPDRLSNAPPPKQQKTKGWP